MNIINEILALIFGFISAYFIFWGFSKNERLYQYPFIAGLTCITYIVPQMQSILKFPQLLTQAAIARAFFMSCLCLIMIWFGYQNKVDYTYKGIHKNTKKLTDIGNIDSQNFSKNKIYNDDNELLNISLIYIFVGLLSNIASTFLEDTNPLAGGGRTGITTVLFFLGRNLYIGLSLTWLIYLKTKKIRLIDSIALTVSFVFILLSGLVAAKREIIVNFFIIFTLPFYFVQDKAISRKLMAVLLIFGILLINPYTISTIRQSSGIRGDWTRYDQADYSKIFESIFNQDYYSNVDRFFNEEEQLEMRNASFIMDYVWKDNKYGWGTGFWNELIFTWVPAQFLSQEFKASLQVDTASSSCKEITQNYGYSCRAGQTKTGFAEAFAEFDYFGCFVFYMFSYLYKFLWVKATKEKSLLAQLAYIHLIVRGTHIITHGTNEFPSRVLFFIIFSIPIALTLKKEINWG